MDTHSRIRHTTIHLWHGLGRFVAPRCGVRPGHRPCCEPHTGRYRRFRWSMLFSLSSLVVLLASGVLTTADLARASTSSVVETFDHWAPLLAADGKALQSASQQAQCAGCLRAAQRFFADATTAREAIAAQQPSTPTGAQLQRLALAAFSDLAQGGQDYVRGLQILAQHQQASALRLLRAGAAQVNQGAPLFHQCLALLTATSQKPGSGTASSHGAVQRTTSAPQRSSAPSTQRLQALLPQLPASDGQPLAAALAQVPAARAQRLLAALGRSE